MYLFVRHSSATYLVRKKNQPHSSTYFFSAVAFEKLYPDHIIEIIQITEDVVLSIYSKSILSTSVLTFVDNMF